MLLCNRNLLRTLASSLAAGILVVMTSPSAMAVTALKKVQVGDGQQLFLMFDSKISQGQIKTEFFNDTVQLSLNDVSVYPAKIFSVGGPDLTKVFAYQYAPKLVRCRLTLKGDAESYKERVSVHVDGKMLTVRIGGNASAQDSVSLSAAQSVREKAAPKKAEAQASWGSPVAEEPKLNADEKLLLDKVLREPEKAEKAEKGEKSEKSEKAEKSERSRRADKSDRSEKNSASSLGGRREGPSFMRPILVLGGIFALMGAVLFLVVRVRNARRSGSAGAGASGKITGVLGKLMDQTLGARREKMIDVVATHNLGPKKSITIVRISGRLLVLGVSGESINLIAQLPDRTDAPSNSEVERILNAEMEAEARRAEGHLTEPLEPEALEQFLDSGKALGYAAAAQAPSSGAVSARRNAFQDTLSAKIQPSFGNSAQAAAAPARESVRDRIKNRVQGMKQL